jgi:N-acetylmuramoyl-L-alanine amidase
MAVRYSRGFRPSRRTSVRLLCLAAVVALVLAGNQLWNAAKTTPTTSSGAARVTLGPALPIAATANPTVVTAGTAPGTCLAFDPRSGERHITVFVDPGHGGVDVGTSGTTSDGTTLYEKDLALETGLDLLGLLRNNGYHVVMSRIDDRLLIRPNARDLSGDVLTLTGVHDDIEARIACANAAHARVLVSIHFNAFMDPMINGTETIYDSARPFSALNLRLATLMQRAVLARFHAAGWAVPDRGVIDDSAVGTPALTAEAASYGHLLELGPAAAGWLKHPSAMPGILIEPLFLSHPAEADVATSKEGQQVMARGMADALNTFFASAGQP